MIKLQSLPVLPHLFRETKSIILSLYFATHSGGYDTKTKEEKARINDEIYRHNQESLVVFGPIKERLTSSGIKASVKSGIKRWQRKPLIEQEHVGLVDSEESERLAGDQGVECEDKLVGYDKSGNHSANDTFRTKQVVHTSSTCGAQSSGQLSSDQLKSIFAIPFVPNSGGYICDSVLEGLFGNFKIPSVSTILNETMPEESRRLLENWKKRKIAEMGEEAFEEEMAGIRKRGHDLHSCIEDTLRGTPVSELVITADMEGYWESIQDVLCDVKDLNVAEAKIRHPYLYYGGRLDCIAMYKKTLCVIDWKTSAKKKRKLEYTYDNPVQLAAYAGAVNAMEEFDLKLENGLLVMVYPDGSPAHAHFMTKNTLSKYWKIWLQRVHLYWTMKQKALEGK